MQRCTLVLDVAQRLNYFEIRVLCKRSISVRKVCPQRSAFVVVAGVLQNGKFPRILDPPKSEEVPSPKVSKISENEFKTDTKSTKTY